MTGTYNVWLQLLSFVVAVIASYVALDMASRVTSSAPKSAKYWLIGGATAMGTGIWSMHFVGMLAFSLPIPIGYDVTTTMLSMLIAILASGFALFTINRSVLTLTRLSISGIVMGIGIASMHYVGMAAMQMSPPIRYDTLLYVLSIVIAIGASIAALWITFHLRSDTVANVALKRVGAAVVMGIAIVGMHYTGMAAANFAPNSICLGNPQQIGNLWMAITIGSCTLLFLAATMAISVFDSRLASSTAKLAQSVMAANNQLKGEIEVRRQAEDALQRTNAELLEMKMAAETANQAKSEFLANVSHELRTPLTLILAPLEQLLATGSLQEDHRLQVERVQRNALLLLNRVNDILDFSKAEADKFDVRWSAVNLCELIPMLIGDVVPMAQAKGCSLACHVDPALDAVATDRSHFEKILLNLLSNALKFTPSGGWIRVEVLLAAGDAFELAIVDSGIGIPSDKLPLLFNRFQQVDTSATRAYGGTGIGLALVKELAELLGGEVGVESEPGKGSRFFVRLPRGTDRLESLRGDGERPAATMPTYADAMLRGARFREGHVDTDSGSPADAVDNADRPTVLVADDHPDMLAYVSELLAGECNVLTATNGERAWSMLQEQRVDLLVSDVMMPEVDGLELTRRVKGSRNFSHLPVILVTARGGSDASVTGLESGADDYIAKPFSPPELRARVRAALRMAQVQSQLREKSREAGMAMVATGILHNIGNILNGVTVSSGLIQEQLQQSKIPRLQQVAQLLQEHVKDLPDFITRDRRGQVLPSYINELSAHLEGELSNLMTEVETLRSCTEHVASLIDMQQQFAVPHRDLREVIGADVLMERAYKLCANTLDMHDVQVVREFECTAGLMVDYHKVLQILLNLLGNARHAVRDRTNGERRIRLRTTASGNMVRMEVMDNGIGIEAEHLPLIFNQGFTTKKDGHGIGLHSSANWARELGGRLTCHSAGPGEGAVFVLELPMAEQSASPMKAVAT
jgi:signal transduction histidine kinase